MTAKGVRRDVVSNPRLKRSHRFRHAFRQLRLAAAEHQARASVQMVAIMTAEQKTQRKKGKANEMEMILGAQLFTLRDYTQTAADLDFTLQKVAEMGYTTVQISAIGPIPAETVREICDRHGLKIVLTHTDPIRIMNETEAVIREHEVMGCDYIGIGMMPPKYRTPEWLCHFAMDYKEPAKKIAAAGKRLMYHNHNLEFQKFDGKLIMDTLMEAFTPEEMGVTLDTFWVQMGGADVCDWIEKLGDRIPCVHLKDMDVRGMEPIMAPVMEGNLNFPKILNTLEKIGKTKYLLVEQDVCVGSPFDCLKRSYGHLHTLGYR